MNAHRVGGFEKWKHATQYGGVRLPAFQDGQSSENRPDRVWLVHERDGPVPRRRAPFIEFHPNHLSIVQAGWVGRGVRRSVDRIFLDRLAKWFLFVADSDCGYVWQPALFQKLLKPAIS